MESWGNFEFMRKYNGGRGEIIGEYWLELFSIEELQGLNDDYELQEFLPDHIIIGSMTLLGKDILALPDKINEMWA
jgi:hypothetical protein